MRGQIQAVRVLEETVRVLLEAMRMAIEKGAPYSHLFFIRFKANLSEYGSYSLHIRMFRYIRKHHLFALFAYIRFKIFASFRSEIFAYWPKNFYLLLSE